MHKINLIEKTDYHSTSRNEVAGDSAENLKIQGLMTISIVSCIYTLDNMQNQITHTKSP